MPSFYSNLANYGSQLSQSKQQGLSPHSRPLLDFHNFFSRSYLVGKCSSCVRIYVLTIFIYDNSQHTAGIYHTRTEKKHKYIQP